MVSLSCVLSVLILILVGLVIYRVYLIRSVLNEVAVEAGSEVPVVEDFLADGRQEELNAVFVSDVSQIDTKHVDTYEIDLEVNGHSYASELQIEDTVSPQGVVQENNAVPLNGAVSADDLVSDIEDETDVTVSFAEEPDLSEEGTQPVTIILTDEGGNQSDFDTNITVFLDTEAPVIDGVAPLEAFVGDTISYKSTVTVTDNFDSNVDLQVNADAVNPDQAGTYDVIYTATDSSGNTADKATTITVKEKPEDYVDEEEVLALADEVLADITTDDMTLKEKAYAIYVWIQDTIYYVNSSEKDSWTNGAYRGLTEHGGDCFVYFSTAKALLTGAGIPNIDVVKSDTSHSAHYWNLIDVGDGWYHYDTTPRQGGGDFFFLWTDEKLQRYSERHNNSHIYDTSLYPATPTEDSTID